MYAQRRLGVACSSAPSDQSPCCPHEDVLDTSLSTMPYRDRSDCANDDLSLQWANTHSFRKYCAPAYLSCFFFFVVFFFFFFFFFKLSQMAMYNITILYIVQLGFTGIYIIFLISAQKHRLWVLVRTASPRPTIYVLSRIMKIISLRGFFYLKIFSF